MKRLLTVTAITMLVLLVALTGTWTTFAILYSNLPGEWLRIVVALAYAAGLVWGFLSWKPRRRMLACTAGSFVLVWTWWALIPASNDRDWRRDVAVLPSATIEGERVTIRNIRNFDYASVAEYTPRYYDKTFRLDAVEGADFFISYWDAVDSIAHTMLSFRFAGGDHLCLSVEGRREKGESYSPLRGAFKQYELIYVLGDERDLVRLRTNYRKERTYLYPSTLTRAQSRALLLSVLRRVNDLEAHPAFYKTLGRNCTTTLVDHLCEVTGVTVSYHRKLLLNGYSDEFAYGLGQIPKILPFKEMKGRHFISEIARRYDDDPAFSQKVRAHLPKLGR